MTGPRFPTSSEIVDNGLLLASLSTLSVPLILSPAITRAATATRSRLVIILFSRFFNRSPGATDVNCHLPASHGISHTRHWDAVHQLLMFVYMHVFKTAQEMDKVLMDIDVLLRGLDENIPEELGNGMDIVFRVSGDSIAVPLPSSISDKRYVYLPVDGRSYDNNNEVWSEITPGVPPFYPVVALGGTFDHLHPGHKILLSMGAWIASRKVIVGITEDSLLQKKANRDIIQKLSVRMGRVQAFLHSFRPGLEYDVVPIHDVYGPTGWDPDIHALVVSKETLDGANSVAAYRASQSLPPLQLFVIDLIFSTSSCIDHTDVEWLRDNKLSSTYIRAWIVRKKQQKFCVI